MTKLSQFNYKLPENLIAKKPAIPRDECKFLVFDKKLGKIKHTTFKNIADFLEKGDVLVLNNTKVIPARIIGHRIIEKNVNKKNVAEGFSLPRGRKFKVLLLKDLGKASWEVLIDGKKKEVGLKIDFGNKLIGEIVEKCEGGVWKMKFNKSGKKLWDTILKIGEMPLPPYIKQDKNLKSDVSSEASAKEENKKWYQTIYAKSFGSVAAPTAGLHFTDRVFQKLKKKGVAIEYITLHVGMGTFLPVRTEVVEEHKMHAEYIEISKKTALNLNRYKKEGRKIIAVGTTTTRALEAVARQMTIENAENKLSTKTDGRRKKLTVIKSFKIEPLKGEINIFIYPPYEFKFIDGLITNFHLPKSTLLMLVSAFLDEGGLKGIKKIKDIYKEAIKKKYKFYSYGDSMLIIAD